MRQRWLSFGPFRLDPLERRLWRGSELVKLAPKPLALLFYLAERPGRLASKDELLQAVWPDVNVAEAVLKTCVAEIRQVLGDDATSPRWVETVPRHGYRFVAPLQYNNLPSRATSFVGRERELRDVRSLLNNSRLVTLLGAPGVGKSSLAVHVASELLHDLPHGVCWVDLAPLFEPHQIALSIATALGLQDHTGQPILDTLIEGLEERQLLLILDNCEHLADGCGTLIEGILQECSRVMILATSREPLCVDREIAWRIPPLSLPVRSDSAANALVSESVQLFVSRASRSNPTFQLSDQNAGTIADICRRLDGMPLALELAAARVGMFDPEEIAARLDDALALLDNDGWARGARRQTLSKMLEWSFSTLTGKERLALVALTVFAGDFSLAAAESVCAGTQELERREVLSIVSRLVDKSMLVVVDQPDHVRTRFQMLQIVRQFARKEVSPALAPVLPRLLAEFLAELTAGTYLLIRTKQREESYARLDREYSNIRASLEWSISEPDDFHLGLRIAGAVYPYWSRRGHVGEGLTWIQRLLPRDPEAPAAVRARALIGAGTLMQSTANYTAARSHILESVALLRTLNDPAELGLALYHLARMASREGANDEAARTMAESIAVLRQGPRSWFLALALTEKGLHAMYDGRLDESAALHQEAASILRDNDDGLGLIVPLINMAYLATREARCDRALAYCAEALAVLRPIDEHWFVAHTIEMVATAKCVSGQYVEAAQLLGSAERLRKTGGVAWPKNRPDDYENLLRRLRAALSESEFRNAWASGYVLSREEAILAAMPQESVAG